MEMVLYDIVKFETLDIVKLALAAVFTFAVTCKVAMKCK